MSLNKLYIKLRQAAAQAATARVDLEQARATDVDPATLVDHVWAVTEAEAEERLIREKIAALLESV